MKIAVVDDDYTSLTNLRYFLEDEGYDVTAVNNTEELGKLDIYDAIIMDVWIRGDHYPQRGRYVGIDFILEHSRKGEISQKTPILFMSNFGRDDTIIDRLNEVGEYIEKCLWLDKFDFTSLGGLLQEIRDYKEP